MKKSKIFSLNGSTFLNIIAFNKLIILLTILAILGICLGSIFINKKIPFIFDYAQTSFNELFFVKINDNNFLKCMLSSFIFSLIYLILIFLGGTSFSGVLFCPSVFFLKSISLGIVTGYIYYTYGLKGIAFNALVLIPCNIILFLGLLLAAKEAIVFSYDLASVAMPSGYCVSMFSNFKKYCKSFLFILFVVLVSSFIDAFCSSVFIKFFNF